MPVKQLIWIGRYRSRRQQIEIGHDFRGYDKPGYIVFHTQQICRYPLHYLRYIEIFIQLRTTYIHAYQQHFFTDKAETQSQIGRQKCFSLTRHGRCNAYYFLLGRSHYKLQIITQQTEKFGNRRNRPRRYDQILIMIAFCAYLAEYGQCRQFLHIGAIFETVIEEIEQENDSGGNTHPQKQGDKQYVFLFRRYRNPRRIGYVHNDGPRYGQGFI